MKENDGMLRWLKQLSGQGVVGGVENACTFTIFFFPELFRDVSLTMLKLFCCHRYNPSCLVRKLQAC